MIDRFSFYPALVLTLIAILLYFCQFEVKRVSCQFYLYLAGSSDVICLSCLVLCIQTRDFNWIINQLKMILKYNQKQRIQMTLKVVNAKTFFKKPSPLLIRAFQTSQHLLDSFFSENEQGPFERKLSITDQYLIIYQKTSEEYEPVLCLEIGQNIRFQKLSSLEDFKSKTPSYHGFSLINQNHSAFNIYIPSQEQLEQWFTLLNQSFNQLGFHEQYRVISKIGKGSTSTVYMVQRISDLKIFAAKAFLKTFLQSKPQRKSSIFNEISLLRALKHTNILKIIGVYQTVSTIYILTEHLQGGTLLERINQAKGLTLAQTKYIMKGIISALSYLHKYNVMHRDLKLENIMFRSKDSLDVVLIDFGLAVDSSNESYIFYRCGTPGYIAPQIMAMKGHQSIDVACDIFSAGVIMHVLLTNKYLFSGENNQQIYKNNKAFNFDLANIQLKCKDKQGLQLLASMLQMDYFDRITAEQILQHPFILSACQQSDKEQESLNTQYSQPCTL